MFVWLTLPFYDFCGFRSVTVNSVYKLQFFTFIFAVLLPVLQRTERSWGPNCVTLVNFVEIAETAAEIGRFSIFQGHLHVGFLKLQIVGRIISVELPHHANFSWRSVKSLSRYLDFEFWKFWIFNGRKVERVELHHPAKYRQNRSSRGRDMAIIRPPSWIFEILNF